MPKAQWLGLVCSPSAVQVMPIGGGASSSCSDQSLSPQSSYIRIVETNGNPSPAGSTFCWGSASSDGVTHAELLPWAESEAPDTRAGSSQQPPAAPGRALLLPPAVPSVLGTETPAEAEAGMRFLARAGGSRVIHEHSPEPRSRWL